MTWAEVEHPPRGDACGRARARARGAPGPGRPRRARHPPLVDRRAGRPPSPAAPSAPRA
ncbi:MAG: hypothetical protein MZU84_00835 [Sphingobacterium sp.]|nr:hypothetical protein [Sphingobacterium sp.]